MENNTRVSLECDMCHFLTAELKLSKAKQRFTRHLLSHARETPDTDMTVENGPVYDTAVGQKDEISTRLLYDENPTQELSLHHCTVPAKPDQSPLHPTLLGRQGLLNTEQYMSPSHDTQVATLNTSLHLPTKLDNVIPGQVNLTMDTSQPKVNEVSRQPLYPHAGFLSKNKPNLNLNQFQNPFFNCNLTLKFDFSPTP
jgi:hypothetical protein